MDEDSNSLGPKNAHEYFENNKNLKSDNGTASTDSYKLKNLSTPSLQIKNNTHVRRKHIRDFESLQNAGIAAPVS